MNTNSDKNRERPFSSNGIRLSIGQWIIVAVICYAAVILLPHVWEKFDKFSPGINYRQPYELSNDYWQYQRYCRLACLKYDNVVIGDSVVWGHYVSRDNTLSHYLSEQTGGRFANLGLDGIHPAAMEGLLRYYGKDIKNKNIILHFNPLWMSSPKHDLQTDKEFHFNHPKLVAQFSPKIPCYKTSFSTKLSNVVKRYISFLSWTSHLNITSFDNAVMPAWTIENPYENPLKALTFRLPEKDVYEKAEITGQSENKAAINGFQWVQPEESLQWKFFRRSVKLLEKRKNKIFVLVGPFNEHKLEGENRSDFINLKNKVELWLKQNDVDYFIPPVLSAEFYQDASHPVSRGYEIIAEQLFENAVFKAFIPQNSGPSQ
jgi:hypothetical protein